VPYSLVAGLDDVAYARLANRSPGSPDEIILNDWTARDLGVGPGDEVELDYYVWREEGALETAKASFRVAAVVPLAGAAADRDLTPAYPGITDSLQLADWDPPFPVDLGKIRPRDEDYWRDFRTTPKAFVPLARAQELWGHRLGRVSSVRVYPGAGASLAETGRDYGQALLEALDPADFGVTVEAVREEGLRAATGSTDFGEYFTYFSFFIVVSALLLATMFFRLGVEQRVAEVGLLGALGFSAARVRSLLIREGLVLATLGSVLGAVFAAAYASFVLLALRTVWKGAVGTDELRLHVTAGPLAAAAGAGVVVAGLVVAQTLRGFRHQTVRSLLSGVLPPPRGGRLQGRIPAASAVALLILAGALVAAAGAGVVPHAAAFFGAGASLLAAGLLFQWLWLTRRKHAPVGGLVGLGLRSATYRPGRSLLCMALVAAATFVIVSLGAFQHAGEDVSDHRSGAGGYPLYAESLVPLAYPLDTPAGREALNLADADELHGLAVARFRVRPGDDASCLNLYRPGQPRMLGATSTFLTAGRFRFAAVRARGAEQEANPWTALDQTFEDGAIPAIADQNSITYALHMKLGEDVIIESGRGPVRLRLVAALSGSLFQSELIVSEANFLRMFPDDTGYRFFLFDVPQERAPALTTLLESRLGDQGLDVSSSAERLREFHAVENTYLSTFQALGGLGLLLGTVGLGTVLLRNALERRREMALARAVGFRREQLRTMVLAENLLLLFAGLGLGTGAALVAVLPALLERGGFLPLTLVLGLLLAVAAAGVAASAIAVAVVARFPLLQALRAD
jgi:ABC-type antimicrobial peptide transport system permease subunit